MTEERSVHVYASGRGFVVVPVCPQPDGKGMEVEPIDEVSLIRGLPTSVLLARAIEEAAGHPCEAPRPWKDPQEQRQHHLFAVRLTWHEETLQMHLLPEGEPIAAWPRKLGAAFAARQLIARLAAALA